LPAHKDNVMTSLRISHAHLPLVALALVLSSGLSQVAAQEQPSASAPNTAASANVAAATATPPGKLGPRLLTPAETRDNAAAAGDVKPERPVTPQVSIPFGKKPPANSPSDGPATRRGNAAAANGNDDALARCETLAGEQVRVKCRDKITRDAGVHPLR
jgi:hypothetical protein